LKARIFPRSPKKSSFRVTRVVPVNAFREQAFPAALSPTRERGTTAFGSHPSAKTMLAFTRSLRWLIRAFHKS